MTDEFSINEHTTVPQTLKNWFVFHFIIDMVFAVPLMLAPDSFLGIFGWQFVDPITARVAAAALFGIGIESYLGRNASADRYRGMLNVKIIWSISALIGIGISLLQGAQGNPLGGWVVWGIFFVFSGVWIYWRAAMRTTNNREVSHTTS